MTRARHALSIFVPDTEKGTLTERLTGPEILRRKAVPAEASPQPQVEYAMLGLEHMYLGYAGCFPASAPIHQALAALKPGDPVHLDLEQDRILVRDSAGRRVAALSKSARQAWEDRLSSVRQARVFAVVCRDSEQDLDPERRNHRLVPEWEVPVIEVIVDRSPSRVQAPVGEGSAHPS
jgi:ATP-dependent DNA helicase RecQ